MADTSTTGWRPAKDMRFAASLEAIALAVTEVPFVAQSVPVAFMRSDAGWRTMAIFAPADGKNRFVTEEGHWRGHYVPSLIRAYPFLLRTEEGQQRLTLWPTAKSEPVGEGVEPFLVDGQPTERIRKTISFLLGVDAEIAKAHAPLSLLEAHGTLMSWTPEGLDAPLVLGGAAVYVVDREKFAALDDAVFLTLREMGALEWIYAHLQSLHCARVFAERPPLAVSTVDIALPKLPESAQVAGLPTDLMEAMAADLGDVDL